MSAVEELRAEPARASARTLSAPRLGLLPPLLLAVFLALFLTAPPRICTRTDVDSSWCALLDYAQAHHLQFGKDIIFTYGPLGFLVAPFYSPAAAGLRLAVMSLLCFSATLPMALLAWRLALLWRGLLLAAFVLVVGNIHSGADVLLNLSLVFWGLLCVLEERPRLYIAVFSLVAIAAFGVLVKLTYLITMGASLGAISLVLALRGRRAASLVLAGGFVAATAFLWIAAGQNLPNLVAYVLSALPVCNGFDQAMAVDCPQLSLWQAVLLISLALLSAGLRALAFDVVEPRFRWAQRGTLFAWLTALFFITWKHGLVRADRSHIEYFLFFVPVVLLALEALPAQKQSLRECARAMAVLCCVLAALILQPLFFPGYLQYCLQRPWRAGPANARALLNPRQYFAEMDRQFERETHSARLPKISVALGRASVDVFGWPQAFATFNGYNFTPRPIFQSYAAYNRRLMRLNADYYLSAQRPRFVLFDLSALDDRLPALEDAPLLCALLANYQLVDGESSLLLLKATGCSAPRMTLLREGTVRPGEPISLPGNGENVWLEVAVQPTPLGRIRRLLYRPGSVRLKVLGGRGVARDAQFGAPVPMLAEGFLASPLLLGNSDVVDLYRGNPACRPEAYMVELPPEERFLWQNAITFRLYKVETQLGGSAPASLDRLKFPGFQLPPAELNTPSNPAVLDKGKPLIVSGGHKIYPLDIVSGANAVLSVSGKPALLLPPGGSMRFTIPPGARFVSGSYGLADGSPSHSAEFRVEEQLHDGTLRLLQSRKIQPDQNNEDQGLKPFRLPLLEPGPKAVVLTTLAAPNAKSGQVLSCWAEIGFD